MKSPLRNQAGITLIELVVAIGVGAVATYFVATMLWNTTKESASLTAKNDFNSLTSELQSVFNNPARCQAAFTGQYAVPANKTSVPALNTLGTPGATTTPVQITLDIGNTGAGGTAVYQPGMKVGNDLEIVKFEFLGKKPSNLAVDASGNPIYDSQGNQKVVAQQYEIPLHIVASRRIGGYATQTSTDTATGSVTTTVTAKAGGQTATGGDLLEKTLTLRVTLSDNNQQITGCSGQSNALWVPAMAATSTSTATATQASVNIAFPGGNNAATGANRGVTISPPAFTGATNYPGTDTSTSNKFLLTVYGTVMGTSNPYRSDIRYKENIREIPHALDRVEQLRGVEFNWRDRAYGDGDQLGFIAQDVEKAFPEAVETDKTGLKSVNYAALVVPMIEALKERQKTLVRQEKEIQELRRALGKN